jgi:predicted secreted protein
LALIEEVKAWAAEHAQGPDWKGVARQLHQFAQRWRDSGHLSEKMFAELQPTWKAVIHAAHEPLEAVQKASLARRHGLIAEAQELGAAPTLRIDAVKALQQRWQEEAHTVVLDRKQEQKLWDAFRQPIDEAFARKTSSREQTQTALTPHDKAVIDASKALSKLRVAKCPWQHLLPSRQLRRRLSRLWTLRLWPKRLATPRRRPLPLLKLLNLKPMGQQQPKLILQKQPKSLRHLPPLPKQHLVPWSRSVAMTAQVKSVPK